jgi:hypothetical protein
MRPKRLERDFGRKRWGDEGYAMELRRQQPCCLESGKAGSTGLVCPQGGLPRLKIFGTQTSRALLSTM